MFYKSAHRWPTAVWSVLASLRSSSESCLIQDLQMYGFRLPGARTVVCLHLILNHLWNKLWTNERFRFFQDTNVRCIMQVVRRRRSKRAPSFMSRMVKEPLRAVWATTQWTLLGSVWFVLIFWILYFRDLNARIRIEFSFCGSGPVLKKAVGVNSAPRVHILVISKMISIDKLFDCSKVCKLLGGQNQ